MNLVTREARPVPPNEYREVARACKGLTDPSLSHAERAELARLLEGTSSPMAIRALREALLESGSRRAIAPLRSACARALRWAASRGDQKALKALRDALVDPGNNAESGDAIAVAMLDALGARMACSEAMNLTLQAPSREGDISRLVSTVAWARVGQRALPCHAGWGSTPVGCGMDGLQVLVRSIERSSDRAFVDLLDFLCGDMPPVMLVMGNREGAKLVLESMVSAALKRGPAARKAFVRWLDSSEGWTGDYIIEEVDADSIARFRRLLAVLEEGDRKRVMAVLDKACHGRAEEVLSGQAELFDVLTGAAAEELGKVKTRGYWRLAPGESTTEPLPPLAWIQLGRLKGDGRPHPYLDVLKDWKKHCEPVRRMVLYGTRPGSPLWERVTPLRGEIERQARGLDLATESGRELFKMSLGLRMRLAEPQEKRGVAARIVEQASAGPPSLTAETLTGLARWAYAAGDRRFPVELAEWTVSFAERAAAEGLPVKKRRLVFVLGSMTPEELAPERKQIRELIRERNSRSFTSDAEKEAYMAQYKKKYAQLNEARVTPEAAAAWRAWLERFRKLPVFRDARRPSAAK